MHDLIAHIKLKSMVQSIPVSPADTITNHVHLNVKYTDHS